jgi:glycosyltransferase involved in cell wall biosynthesis
MKKIVIVHDWLTGFRGGERVLEAICELYPDAPIYTLIHKKGSTSPLLESKTIVTSWLNKIPKIHENYRFFLPLMPLAVKSLKIPNDTKIVISSSHCVAKGIGIPDGCKHVSYVHSPMRYIYDQFDNYFGKSNFLIKLTVHLIRPFLHTWDYISNNQIDLLIANSTFVQRRIKLFYNRESIVIHPFVDLKDFEYLKNKEIGKENFFVMVTAFAPNKKVDLAIKVFNKLDQELRIIGSGSTTETNSLLSLAKPNIKFLGNLPRKEVIDILSKAKALIFPGVEDFGIVPLESLASTTPVIAYKGGGVLDTLNEECAIFFEEPTEKDLSIAVGKFSKNSFKKSYLQERTSRFSKEIFKTKFEIEIKKIP